MLAVIIILAVLLGAFVLVGIFLLMTYNGLIRSRVRTNEAWAGIDVQLKRRASLIPNLVETVKGYAAHESDVLEEVTRARSMLEQAGGAASTGSQDILQVVPERLHQRVPLYIGSKLDVQDAVERIQG